MPTLDWISDLVRDMSGADFAFVLSRKGRLVTKNAPIEMPDSGRAEILRVVEAVLLGSPDGGLQTLELRRDQLVPFGGRGAVFVYIGARAEAVLCAVMPSRDGAGAARNAVTAGLVELDGLLVSEADKRNRRRGVKAAEPEPPLREPHLSQPILMHPGRGSIPEITVREASMGRSTMAAIQTDSDAPAISYGYAHVGERTLAEIRISTTSDEASTPQGGAMKIDPAALGVDPKDFEMPKEPPARASQPNIERNQIAIATRESPRGSTSLYEASAQRRVLVARSESRQSQPDIDVAKRPSTPPTPGPVIKSAPPPDPNAPNPRNSSLNAWYRALQDYVEPGADPNAPAPTPMGGPGRSQPPRPVGERDPRKP